MLSPMARLHVLTDDLLFGSRLQAELTGAGHETSLGPTLDPQADAIVADLTHDASPRLDLLRGASQPVLAFYSHVEVDVKQRAEAAGIELVVPRSRIAREGPTLVDALLATES
jgi:hypothetical protein